MRPPEATVLGFLPVVRGVSDPVLAADTGQRLPHFYPLEQANDLFLTASTRAHVLLPSSAEVVSHLLGRIAGVRSSSLSDLLAVCYPCTVILSSIASGYIAGRHTSPLRSSEEGSWLGSAAKQTGIYTPDGANRSWIPPQLAVGGRVRLNDVPTLAAFDVTTIVDRHSDGVHKI